jgi:two-component system vancomycin resistance associated response regulator VraR
MAGESVYPDISPVVKIGEVYSNELTQRELEVIKKLADGKSYQEIADELFVSLDTVRQHIKSIYSKTGFHSNVQLIAVCVARKLLLPGY